MLQAAGGTLSTPTTLPKYGPNGTYIPANTPAYATPATYFASTWAQLLAAVTSAQAGEVVEVTADLTDDGSATTLNINRPSYATNVLVRPTLGKRYQIANFVWSVDHVVIAGFNLVGTFYRLQYCTEAHFWRCVDVTGKAAFSLQSADRSSMTEVILPTRAISVDTGDRIDITSASSQNAYYTTIQGCYVLSSWSGVAQSSPFIVPVTHITAPLYSGMVVADVTLTASATLGAIFMQLPNYDLSGTNSDQCDVQLMVNGVQKNTTDADSNKLPLRVGDSTVNFLNSYRSTYPTTALSAGDHVQVILQNVPVGMQNLDLYLQVGDANYQHNDMIQFIRANHSGGYPCSVRILNNVFDSTENSIIQNGAGGYGDQDCGDLYIAGNYLCQTGQHGIGISSGAYSGNPILPVRTHIVNNLVYCSFGTQSNTQPVTFIGNQSHSSDIWSGYTLTVDNTNNLGDTTLPSRPISLLDRPNMTLLWPECPIDTNTLPLYVTPAGAY